MGERVLILSPLDLQPGATAPDGRVVEKTTMYYGDPRVIACHVTFTDGTMHAYSWPNGAGWQVPSHRPQFLKRA